MGTEHDVASLAVIEKLAGVGRHILGFAVATLRTGER